MNETGVNSAAIELVREQLDRGGSASLQVAASSMHPFLRHGDTIRVTACSLADLSCGDLVVFEKTGALCTHRFISLKEGVVFTKADRSLHLDEPVMENEFLGRVTCVQRGSRLLNLDSRLWRGVNSAAGRLSALCVHLCRVLKRAKELVR